MQSKTFDRNDIIDFIYGRSTFLNKYAQDLVKDNKYQEAQACLAKLSLLDHIGAAVRELPKDLQVDAEVLRSLIAQSGGGGEPYFVHDEENGFAFFSDASAARKEAEDRMAKYENTWCDVRNWGSVDTLCWGMYFGHTVESTVDDGYGNDVTVYKLKHA